MSNLFPKLGTGDKGGHQSHGFGSLTILVQIPWVSQGFSLPHHPWSLYHLAESSSGPSCASCQNTCSSGMQGWKVIFCNLDDFSVIFSRLAVFVGLGAWPYQHRNP